MKSKRTSLNDIAKALNVSKATVSFVLNGKGDEFNISKEKQRLIKEKAKELSYVPNFFAKSLRHGETKTIALVIPDISNEFYAELSKSVQEHLYHHGYNTFIVNTNDDNEMEKQFMRELIQRGIDGMIIAPSNHINELIPILLETHIPVVFTDRPGDEHADFVGIDNRREAERILKLFRKIPKRLVALISNPSEVSTIQERLEGIKLACEKEKIPFNYLDIPSGKEEMEKAVIAEIKTGADTFLALNNRCTLPTIALLLENNFNIPDDIRIISFDDCEAFNYFNPQISALRQPIQAIGIKAAERLYERLKKKENPGEHFILSCEFSARNSH